MELDKQQYLQTFLNLVKCSRSKNQFLKNIQQFDNKFTQAYQGPSFQNKASYQSFNSVPQVQVHPKIKNPFINTFEENNKKSYSPARTNNFIQSPQTNYGQTANLLSNNQNKVNIPHSRSEQQFFKQHQGSKTFHAGFGMNQNQSNLPSPMHAQNQYNQYQPPNQFQPYQNQFQPTQNQFNPNQYNQVPSPFNKGQINQSYNQQLNNYPLRNQNMNAQFNQGLNGYYGSNNLEGQSQPYGQMLKNFANFKLGDAPKYVNPNQLSINSHQNFKLTTSNVDPHPNQFLANLNKEQQPDFVKYYKRLVPIPNKQEFQNHHKRLMQNNRTNPFANP